MKSMSMTIARVRAPSSLLALAAALVAAAALAIPTLAQSPAGGSETDDPFALDVYAIVGDLGTYLADDEDRALYYFTRDVHAGESRCHGACARAWPPLLVEDGVSLFPEEGVSGKLGVVPRPDGTSMATYRGRPLYYFANDEAGQTRGHGLGNTWFVALVDGSSPANPAAMTLESATTELGPFLTDGDGRTLYFFAADVTPGVSTCAADCLDAWPPLTVPVLNIATGGQGVTGVVGVMPGSVRLQVTYDGRPLYYFAGDADPGDTNGHGLNDDWYVASVDGFLPTD